MKTKTAILYCRCSTEEQNRSHLGLEAQRAEGLRFAAENGYTVIEIVEEAVSGKLGLEDRPVLREAIMKCLKSGATLLVSKLCRLSRDAAFVMNLMQTKVKFVVASLGEEVPTIMVHMLAVFGQHEREQIGIRTKSALAVLKAKGVQLGNRTNLSEARKLASASNASKADVFASKLQPSVSRMTASGMSLSAIAAEFNSNGTKTARGGLWTSTTVSNLISRFN